jgi:hypothetical protein
LLKKIRVYNGITQTWENETDILAKGFYNDVDLGIDNQMQVILLTLSNATQLVYYQLVNGRRGVQILGLGDCNGCGYPSVTTNEDGKTIAAFVNELDGKTIKQARFNGVQWNRRQVTMESLRTEKRVNYISKVLIAANGEYVLTWHEYFGNPQFNHRHDFWRATYDRIEAPDPSAKNKLIAESFATVEYDSVSTSTRPFLYAYTDDTPQQTTHLADLNSNQEVYQTNFGGGYYLKRFHQAEGFHLEVAITRDSIRFEAVPR